MKSIVRVALATASVFISMFPIANAHAIAPFTSGTLLVNTQAAGSNSYQATEYTLQGNAIQSFSFPPPSGATEYPRDMAFDHSGKLYVYNGTFNPYLSSYNPSSGAWSNTTATGWSTVNNGSYGGIATWDSTVFVTDMSTYGGEAQGIVAFDTVSGTNTRFATNTGPIDLNMGLNGSLYALNGQSSVVFNSQTNQFDYYSSVSVYDPQTHNLTNTLSLLAPGGDMRGIAVDASGNIFAADWNGIVTRYNSMGNLLGSTNLTCTGFGVATGCSFMDIDVNQSGQLALGGRDGTVWLMNSDFSNATSISTGRWNAFVTFTTPVPIPATAWLLGSGLTFLVSIARKRKPV